MKITGVIPSRYASTRFPGKPLALIGGRSLIERVWRQASKSRCLDEVIIATDDLRIRRAAEGFGASVVMTSRSCASGTDRLAEVARTQGGRPNDIFINIQGDEPLISPALIDALARALTRDRNLGAATAAYPLYDSADLDNPNIVKVVRDLKGNAMYFSRSPIPFHRSNGPAGYLKHLGLYAYRREFLLRFASWRPTPVERTERLEQMRILEKGYPIGVVLSKQDSFGVDVPSDVGKIERLLK